MPIRDGKLDWARWEPARVTGGPIKPQYIIAHDTASGLAPGAVVKWFQSPQCQTSAHIVIERSGECIQMVRFDRKAAHAGESKWDGKTFLNSCSIGIEIVAPGKLSPLGKSWFGQTFEGAEFMATEAHGKGLWLPYEPAQIETFVKVCREIAEHYADVNSILAHWEVSPGRKVDVAPNFPLEDCRRRVFEEEAPTEPNIEPQKSMVTSKEGGIAAANGTVAAGVAAVDVQNVVVATFQNSVKSGKGFSVIDLIGNIIASPLFLVGMGIAVASAVAWWLRAQKRWKLNI